MELFKRFILTLDVGFRTASGEMATQEMKFDSKEINVCLLFHHDDLGSLPVSTFLLMTVRM
jgi:hypothetical protein